VLTQPLYPFADTMMTGSYIPGKRPDVRKSANILKS
jgi:hypothetical protein